MVLTFHWSHTVYMMHTSKHISTNINVSCTHIWVFLLLVLRFIRISPPTINIILTLTQRIKWSWRNWQEILATRTRRCSNLRVFCWNSLVQMCSRGGSSLVKPVKVPTAYVTGSVPAKPCRKLISVQPSSPGLEMALATWHRRVDVQSGHVRF